MDTLQPEYVNATRRSESSDPEYHDLNVDKGLDNPGVYELVEHDKHETPQYTTLQFNQNSHNPESSACNSWSSKCGLNRTVCIISLIINALLLVALITCCVYFLAIKECGCDTSDVAPRNDLSCSSTTQQTPSAQTTTTTTTKLSETTATEKTTQPTTTTTMTTDVSVNGCELFVGDYTSDAAHYLLNTRTGDATPLTLTGRVFFTACTSDRRVFFTDLTANSAVWIYDNKMMGAEDAQIALLSGNTNGIAVDEQLARVFVSVTNVGVQSITYAGDGLKTITTSVFVSYGLATDSANRMLYFTDWSERTLARVSYEDLDNPTDHTVIKTGFPNAPSGVLLDKPGDRIYVLLYRGAIWSFVLSTEEEIGEITSAPSDGTYARSLVMCGQELLYPDREARNVWRIGRDETDGNKRVKVNNQQLGGIPYGMCRL